MAWRRAGEGYLEQRSLHMICCRFAHAATTAGTLRHAAGAETNRGQDVMSFAISRYEFAAAVALCAISMAAPAAHAQSRAETLRGGAGAAGGARGPGGPGAARGAGARGGGAGERLV